MPAQVAPAATWKKPSPPRAAIRNIDSGERFNFQFNPEAFTEAFGVNYAKHTVPGLSFEIMNYINTKNVTIPLSIYLSQGLKDEAPIGMSANEGNDVNELLNAKSFLQSLVYPVETPAGSWLAPPLVMFVWPSVVTMVAVVTSLSFGHQRFSERDLATIAMTADLTLEECRSVQRFSSDVRREGSDFGRPDWGR
jgi:hypothetical protein